MAHIPSFQHTPEVSRNGPYIRICSVQTKPSKPSLLDGRGLDPKSCQHSKTYPCQEDKAKYPPTLCGRTLHLLDLYSTSCCLFLTLISRFSISTHPQIAGLKCCLEEKQGDLTCCIVQLWITICSAKQCAMSFVICQVELAQLSGHN